MKFDTIVHLGAGPTPPVDRYGRHANNIWLAEASEHARRSIHRRLGDDEIHQPEVQLEERVIAAESAMVMFREYNLSWASGIGELDSAVRRLYPGLQCVTEERCQTVDVASWVRELALDAEGHHLLLLDLGAQNSSILEALIAEGVARQFRYIIVRPMLSRTRASDVETALAAHIDWQWLTEWPSTLGDCGFLQKADEILERHPLIEMNRSLEKSLASTRAEAQSAQDELAAYKTYFHAEQQAREAAESQAGQLQTELQRSVEQLADTTAETQRQETQLAALREEKDALNRQLEAERHAHETTRQAAEREKSERQALERAEAIRADVEKQIDHYQRQLEEVVWQRDNLKALLEEHRQSRKVEVERFNHLLETTREQAEKQNEMVAGDGASLQASVRREMARAEDQLGLIKELLVRE